MKYILSNIEKKYCTKEIYKIVEYILIFIVILLIIVFVRYKPIYEVYLNGDSIGYVRDKDAMEEIINNEILFSNNDCIVFTALNIEPTYELKLGRDINTNEEEIKQILINETTTMYKVYAINLNNETKTYVSTWDEAEELVNSMKETYSDLNNEEITVTEKYTENLEDLSIVKLADAEISVDNELRTIKTEQEKIAEATCNGVYLSVKPVSGNITSRYGAVESVRNHTHKGLDIAAPAGTTIKTAANGIVSFAGWMSGYGNLVIIDHDNGVQTYYGHCSKVYVSEGQSVIAGDKIAAVGSTGDSTGNHLHFEIRVNGKQINPQNYIYK